MSVLSPDNQRENVLSRALEIGFDLAGIAALEPPPDADRFEAWLDAGRHGTMSYLERGRRATVHPAAEWPRGRSLLMVGLGHSRAPVELPGGGRIARYAAGRDYHNVVGKKLQRLRKRLIADGLATAGSAFVDATPLLERSHAEAAGLGFASKAANLLTPAFGPWFFLGEIILDVELEPTPMQRPGGSCGSCTACIDACPTDAIVAPGEVDARRCISYATIEHRGLVEHELRAKTGGWAFGCDICSEVCPWGSKAPSLAERFGTRAEFEEDAEPGAVLVSWMGDAEGPHTERFRGSPLRRPGAAGLARNAAIALGNRPTERGRDGLIAALEGHPDPGVRAAAAWALARGHREDRGVQGKLDRAIQRERDDTARDDMHVSLRGSPDVRFPHHPTSPRPDSAT